MKDETLLYDREERLVDGVKIVVDKDGVAVSNAKMRKALYRLFTYKKFGHLGKGNRIPIPNCVTDKIKEMYPDDDDSYMGFDGGSYKNLTEVGRCANCGHYGDLGHRCSCKVCMYETLTEDEVAYLAEEMYHDQSKGGYEE